MKFCQLGGWNHIRGSQLIDLHSIRLCFQLIWDQGESKRKKMGYVVSNPILDKKSYGPLKLVELSASTASVNGGERLILLCENVKQPDVDVVFFEEDKQQKRVWEGIVNYQNSPTFRVHHQHAISFLTPRYKDIDATEPIEAFIQLVRRKDGERSKTIEFRFIPNEHSEYMSLHVTHSISLLEHINHLFS